jgi:hypothetical protein
MRTARRWPLLRKMYTKGGYAEVIGEFVAAMPSGDWYGRPLIGDVNSGLGCSRLGIRLPRIGSG